MKRTRRFLPALLLCMTIVLSSCTGAQVQDWFARRGTTIDWQTGHAIAVNLNAWAERQRDLARALDYIAATSVPYAANWDRVAACESGGRWNLASGNGYYGGLQFLPSTWRSVGGSGMPHQNSRAEQIKRAEILRHRAGLGQWPVCGSRWHG